MKKIFLLTLLSVIAISLQAKDDVYAFISDPSGTPTNIRNAPNGKIVKTLKDNSGGFVVTLISAKNGWWKIDSEVEFWGDNEYEITLKGSSTGYWVHHSVLSFTIAGDPTNAIHARPSKTSKVIPIPDSTEVRFRPLDRKGKWLKVVSTDGRVTGWLHSDQICYNPLTTCP